MMCAASGLAYTRTLGTFGPTHGTTMVRKLEHATALAKSSQGRRAKELFQEIIDSSPNPEWVLAVSEVELARVLKDGGELAAARDLLEKLVPRLLREKARWAWHERIEASTLLGSIYVALKSWVDAEHWLFLSIDSHLANDTACPQKVVNCMEEIARFYRARGDNALACETYRVAVNILASDEADVARVALLNLKLANAEVLVGVRSEAAARFRTAIRCLRRRKHDADAREAMPGARRQLAELIKPAKRLRRPTSPEDV